MRSTPGPRRAPLALFAVLLLCATAGCLGVGGDFQSPSDGVTQTVNLTMFNAHTVSYEVQFAVVPDDNASVAFTYANGTTVTRDRDALVGSSPAQLADVRAVEFAGEGGRSESFALRPNTGTGRSFERVPGGAELWLLVWETSETGEKSGLRSWVQTACRPQTPRVGVDLVVANDGRIGVSTRCEST